MIEGKSDSEDLDTLSILSLCVWGDKIVSVSADKKIKIWNPTTGICEKTLRGHKNSITSLCILIDKIVSGFRDYTIKIWY